MIVSKTSNPIQIKIKMPNPLNDSPASSQSQNQDFKDMDVLCIFKIKIESQNSEHGSTKDQWPYPNQDWNPNPSQEPLASFKAPNQDYKDMDVIHTFKSRHRAIIWNMGLPKTSDHIHIKIKMSNPSQDPLTSSKALNQGLNSMDTLCTFKIKIENKDQWQYPNYDQDAKPHQEPPGSFKAQQQIQGHQGSLHLQT